jgi:hypothetical protein
MFPFGFFRTPQAGPWHPSVPEAQLRRRAFNVARATEVAAQLAGQADGYETAAMARRLASSGSVRELELLVPQLEGLLREVARARIADMIGKFEQRLESGELRRELGTRLLAELGVHDPSDQQIARAGAQFDVHSPAFLGTLKGLRTQLEIGLIGPGEVFAKVEELRKSWGMT